jgi:hypothetical protein
MPTGNTTLLGLALPVEGELDGTWGDVVNQSITSLVDSAVAGTTTLTVDEDVTLSDTVLEANQARQAIIRWAPATGTTTRNITAPARSKAYIVINATGGTQSIVLRGAGPTTGVTVVSGEKCLAVWNGSDFVKVASITTFTGTGAAVLANSPTLTNMVFDGDYTEEVFTITDGASVNLDPSNGTVQLWTFYANRSPTATGFASGQSMTLMLEDFTGNTITWPSVTWKTDGGSPPVLNATGYTVVQLWKVSTVLYGARVGDN